MCDSIQNPSICHLCTHFWQNFVFLVVRHLSCRIADQRQSTDTRCDFATDTRPQCLKIIQKKSHSFLYISSTLKCFLKKYFYSKQPNKKLLIKWDFFCDFSTLCEILDSLITRRASTRDIAEIRHLCNSYNFEFSETKMQIYIVDDLCSTIFLRVDERQISCQNLPVYVALQKTWKVLLKIWQVSLMSPLNSRQFLWGDT